MYRVQTVSDPNRLKSSDVEQAKPKTNKRSSREVRRVFTTLPGLARRLVLRAAASSLFVLLALPHDGALSHARNKMLDRTKETTVTVVAGSLASSSAKMAHDLGAVLNDGNLRVLPILGYGGFHSVSDVLHLSGVDVGLVHEDALEALRRDRIFPDMDGRLRYIARLHREPIFIIARSEIDDLDDLEGKTVNLGPGAAPLRTAAGNIWGETIKLGPGAEVQHTTQALILQTLGIRVIPAFLNIESALMGLRDGSLDASILIGPELTDMASKLGADDRLRLIAINADSLPNGGTLPEVYQPIEISGGEYAEILPPGSRTNTISVSLVMVTSNWPRNAKEYDKVERFAVSLFDNFSSFSQELRSPAWRDVSIAAPVDGWQRFAPAEAWVAANPTAAPQTPQSLPQLEEEFQAFLASADLEHVKDLPSAERAKFFKHFLSWPQNPAQIEIPVHRTDVDGLGPMIGTLTAMNTEINIVGQNEIGVMFRPDLAGMQPDKRHAFQIYEKADCGAREKDGVAVPGLAAGDLLWLAGAAEGSSDEGDETNRIGDLPDLVANRDGTATKEFVVARLSLADLVQRAVVIHAGSDESSSRWACAAIK